ncbi:MAG: dihydropteroate synthase [Clostridia bacterium]|nr:dihydropteroate synthase [Clostridia bacterium]
MYNIRVINIRDIADAKETINKIGVMPESTNSLAGKAVHFTIKIEGVAPIAANILKQEILSKGGDAAINKGCVNLSIKNTDVLLMGTYRQLNQLVYKLKLQPFGLKDVANQIKQTIDLYKEYSPRKLSCGNQGFILGERTLLMDVLNIHNYQEQNQVMSVAEKIKNKGADIIEITWEGDTDKEFALESVEQIHDHLKIPICINVYDECLPELIDKGVSVFNFVIDQDQFKNISSIAAQKNKCIIIVHGDTLRIDRDIISQIYDFIKKRIKIALDAGVSDDNIVIDPGIGLCKNAAQSIEILNRLEEFKSLGYPIMIGTSRQPLIGDTFIDEQNHIEGIAPVITMAIAKGVDLIRVRGIDNICKVVKVADTIARS